MKRKILVLICFLFLIIFLIIIQPQTKLVGISKIDFNLDDDELAVVFINQFPDSFLLFFNEEVRILVVLNYKKGNLQETLKKFNIRPVNVLLIKDIEIDFNYHKKIKLTTSYEEEDIRFKLEQNIIKVEYEEALFCIYVKRMEARNKFLDCDFIYFYHVLGITHLDISKETDLIFYHNKRPLPTFLMEKIYERWLDTYILRDDEFTIMKMEEDYFNIIAIPNI
ncbi:MAG: hypothetical protein ACOXZR_02490 [Bacilli bacterium]|jgi:hypothetical protein